MTIQHAILGFLSWRSFSGYDLKKLFTDSPFFHWSGNNNQVYTTLLQLQQEGLVTNEAQYPERGPARKVYTITEAGLVELRRWVVSTPELPQSRHTFLAQLAWADQLPAADLYRLLAQYEHEVEMQLLMRREQERRGADQPARTPREAYLWRMMSQNGVMALESELAWVRELHHGLGEL